MAAVRTSTASQSVQTGPEGPIRTCVGCRQRAAAAELLRVVAAPGASGDGSAALVVPDPRHRTRGRGAWLHPDPACAELAQRRRAFARALRIAGPVDAAPVLEYVASFTRQETHEHEQAMKPQR